MNKDIKISFLVLDFLKPIETRNCLESIKKHALFPHLTILLDNGGNEQYPWDLYKEELCDTLISKKDGMGGGFGQTDLIRYCPTEYFFFIQNDQILIRDINRDIIDYFIKVLDVGFHCIDLNGDQSRKGIWTDRAHFMRTSFFNSLGPFPNSGPGKDNGLWNEKYLQDKFINNNYKIAHIEPLFFQDEGRNSIRQAGDGLYKHNCDDKRLWILKFPTYVTEPYPPFDKELEWPRVLKGEWEQGSVPVNWAKHSFKYWNS